MPDIPCNWSAVRRPHAPHDWEPQPGMDPVRCAGLEGAASGSPGPNWLPDVHPTNESYAYQHPSPFTWAESVASHGTGPTATIDIDIHAPGHDEPVPVEIPIAGARVLHAMLSGVLAEHDGAGDPTLREVIAGALRDAAFSCDGECGSDEAACAAAHPIQEAATTHGVISDLYGPIDDIAEVVAGVVQPVIDAERGRADTAEALAIAQRKVIERQAREALAATTEPGTPRARRTPAPPTDQPGDGGGQ